MISKRWHSQFKESKNPTKKFIKNMFGGRVRFWGGDEETTTTQTSEPKFYATPEYSEATQARQGMSTKLTDWGNQPGYGIIEPNYDSIYSNAVKRLNEYYYGSPLSGGGLSGKISSDLARRNVSDSPASSIMKGRMGAEMASQLSDVSTQQDIARSQAGEQARTNWLSAMSNLANMKPSGTWGGTTTTTTPTDYSDTAWSSLGTIGSGLMNLYNTSTQRNWMSDMMGKYLPTQTQSSIKDSGYSETPDWLGTSLKGASSLLPLFM